MTLYQILQEARSEEDVKDAYVKALGLKGYSKNLSKQSFTGTQCQRRFYASEV